MSAFLSRASALLERATALVSRRPKSVLMLWLASLVLTAWLV